MRCFVYSMSSFNGYSEVGDQGVTQCCSCLLHKTNELHANYSKFFYNIQEVNWCSSGAVLVIVRYQISGDLCRKSSSLVLSTHTVQEAGSHSQDRSYT
jgi:hypothetical protein